MALYSVHVSHDFVIECDDPRSAQATGAMYVREALGDGGVFLQVNLLEGTEGCPGDYLDCVPWGSQDRDERSVRQRLRDSAQATDDALPFLPGFDK